MNQENTILGLMAQTSIHAGTGQNTGIIDLPIQREGHNGWPCVYGSAVKGALRTRAEQDDKINNDVSSIFGPPMKSGGGSEYAGSLLVSDARILLFPVRSLTSQFKWVTCPSLLNRLKNDLQRFNMEDLVNFDELDEIKKDEAISPNTDGDIFLEEYRYKTRKHESDLTKTIGVLSKFVKDDNFSENLKSQLLILSDDSFTYLVQHATPVNAHIAIDNKTKTVSNGSLWYEETLPPETLLYIGLSANESRCDKSLPAKDVLNKTIGLFTDKPWFQLGGNETVGMGWCAVKNIQDQEK